MSPATPPARRISKSLRRIGLATIALSPLAIICGVLASCSALLPGDTFKSSVPLAVTPVTPLADELRADVEQLAGVIGERNLANPDGLRAAENYIAAELSRCGYRIDWQTYTVHVAKTADAPERHLPASNISVELRGSTLPDEIIVLGAHYDSVHNRSVHSPGANDNASGTAAVLALARRFARTDPASSARARTLRFVFFTNEEPPYFWTDQMGSLVYARAAKTKGEHIAAMLSIETIGSFSDAPGSQDYPPLVGLLYPDTADFIAFVGMADAEPLVRRCVSSFRAAGVMAAEGAAMPTLVPRVGSSDHWSFWKQGYQSLMVTDTAPYRYKHYHKPTDTPDKLNYPAMAKVVEGLTAVINDLTSGSTDTPAAPSTDTPPSTQTSTQTNTPAAPPINPS